MYSFHCTIGRFDCEEYTTLQFCRDLRWVTRPLEVVLLTRRSGIGHDIIVEECFLRQLHRLLFEMVADL